MSPQIVAAARRRVCAVVRFSYAKRSLHRVCGGPTITSIRKVRRRRFNVDGAGNHGSKTRVLTRENTERLVRDVLIIHPSIPTLYDCFLFLHLKRWLGGRRFGDDEFLLKTAVVDRFDFRAEDFYAAGSSAVSAALRKVL